MQINTGVDGMLAFRDRPLRHELSGLYKMSNVHLWSTSVHKLQVLYYANTHSLCYCTVLTVLVLIGELAQEIYECFIWLCSVCQLQNHEEKPR